MICFDEAFDFIVVGSGGGSMCAGLAMREAGKKVLILEKSDLIGGTTARSGGVMWVPNNRFMKAEGIEDSFEKAARYLESVIGHDPTAAGATTERQHAYLRHAPEMIDFLVSQGIELKRATPWPDYYDNLPGGSQEARTVVAPIFNVNELGAWKHKLRPGFLPYPAALNELMLLPFYKKSWAARIGMLKVAGRFIAALLTGKKYAAAGSALQGRMLQASIRAGVDIRTGAQVTELIAEGERIVGVVVRQDGKSQRIGAHLGVLVNAGGFARNQAMRDQYQPGTKAAWTSVIEGDTGEMIQEMQRHGAALAQMEEMVGHQTTPVPGFDTMDVKPGIQSVTAKPHAILVDQSGVRYMNEGGSYMAYCKAMLERNKTVPAVPSWAIFDTYFLNNYMLCDSMPGTHKPKSWTSSGYLKKADSIEELARLLNIDPATLRHTVDRWNGFVDKGVDEDFHRGENDYDNWLGDPFHQPSQTLGRIDQGPFYAVPVIPGDVGTYGGVVTDIYGRVLKEDGTPMVGLYATGVSTASVMGRAYPGAGSSVGPSFTWGYVAAKHALGILKA